VPQSDFNTRIIEEFRANHGRVGHGFEGAPLLLLHTDGARSGEQRISPTMYLKDGDRYVVFASRGGSDVHPAWYHNLTAHPAAQIEVGDDTVDVVAVEAQGAERDDLYARQVALYPIFGKYAAGTTRTIPVMILTPRAT
jgi:deazaflavin-dependent oxidoreductase (nitroreductase family)